MSIKAVAAVAAVAAWLHSGITLENQKIRRRHFSEKKSWSAAACCRFSSPQPAAEKPEGRRRGFSGNTMSPSDSGASRLASQKRQQAARTRTTMKHEDQ
jgi:hypothetical protein